MKPKVAVVAGGLATRMRAVSGETPKAMLEINGKPLLQHQVEVFKKQGFTDFVFCIAHFGQKIRDCFGNGSGLGIRIEYSEESELLGTAGAVKLAESKLGEVCIVFYGDNLTTMDFGRLLEFHESKESDFTVVAGEVRDGKITGSLLTLDNGRITLFLEHPEKEEFVKRGKIYYNRGIYVMNKKVFSLIPDGKCDFGHDLIPALIKQKAGIYGYVTDEFFREIGRPEKYERLKEELKGVVL